MTTHLLQITVGPVQDFIAQARRTRDLWYGSHLLSEVSRAVARSLAADHRVSLIFPALDPNDPSKAELEACPTPFRPRGHVHAGDPPLAVANIILAEVADANEAAVRALAATVRDAMQEFWKVQLAGRAKSACNELLAVDRQTPLVWEEQIDTFLEFITTWTEVNEQRGGHKAARDRLNKAIAARKNLRDFEPWREDRKGKPKSALDGARVSVLKEKEERPRDLVRKYRLGENEQLDAVGLVKRAGGETKESRQSHELQFVPIINVALAPWMRLAGQTHGSEFEAVEVALRGKDIDWPRVARQIACGHDLFGFDASIFLRNRWWPEFKEQGIFEPPGLRGEQDKTKREAMEREWRRDVEKWCRAAVGPRHHSNDPPRILDLMSEPNPYVACLAADGDGMGAALDALGTAGDHRAFSRELAKFARAAREIVENAHHLGSLVYSGGDDVLAFLPVSTALACADALRKKFEEIMGGALEEADGKLKGGLTKLPTLSVGIGIGHVMESMGDLLELGRRAERLAKGGSLADNNLRRNALAVILDKRSGGTREWRSRWSEWEPKGGPAGSGGPAKRLQDDAGLLDSKKGRLSVRKVHQIADILKRLPDPKACAPEQAASFGLALESEVKRALRRGDRSQQRLGPEHVGLALDAAEYAGKRKAVAEWINRMLIARAIAESKPEVAA